MAGERTLPGLGLTAYWELGDNTWKEAMDANLRKISVLLQGRALSVVSTAPSSPTDGEVYIASGVWGLGNPGDIIFRDDGGWVVITPLEGWLFYVVADSEFVQFDGTDWVAFSTGAAAAGIAVSEFLTQSNTLTNAHFAGNVILTQHSGTGTSTITLNSGITGTEPVTIINRSGGVLTITAGAGVTIRSAGDVLTTSAANASVTLIPVASNDYYLIGALDDPA